MKKNNKSNSSTPFLYNILGAIFWLIAVIFLTIVIINPEYKNFFIFSILFFLGLIFFTNGLKEFIFLLIVPFLLTGFIMYLLIRATAGLAMGYFLLFSIGPIGIPLAVVILFITTIIIKKKLKFRKESFIKGLFYIVLMMLILFIGYNLKNNEYKKERELRLEEMYKNQPDYRQMFDPSLGY